MFILFAEKPSSSSVPETGAGKEMAKRPTAKPTKGKEAVAIKSGALPKITQNIKVGKGMFIKQTMGLFKYEMGKPERNIFEAQNVHGRQLHHLPSINQGYV